MGTIRPINTFQLTPHRVKKKLASDYPRLEFSPDSCHIIKYCGSVQESASWLSPPASSPLQPDTPHRRCCWSSKFECDLTIIVAGVEKLSPHLAIHKASDSNQILAVLWKNLLEKFLLYWQIFFSESLRTGVLPADWLLANVRPIFLKGDKHIASNYRTVFLSCVCCKLLQHIIVKHLLGHLKFHDILTNKQHDFRSGHSCESQLLITSHDLLTSANEVDRVDIAILFQSLRHGHLIGWCQN